MKRNLALRFMVVLLACIAAVGIITGCQQPADNNPDSNPVVTLSGPGNLKAAAYAGVNYLTWDPVVDASGYEVWRKSDTEKITKLYTITKPTIVSYTDAVSLRNTLVNGTTYTYTVYSLCGSTDSSTRAAVTGSSAVLESGSSSCSVTADIPARTETVLTPFTGSDNITPTTETYTYASSSAKYLYVNIPSVPNYATILTLYYKGTNQVYGTPWISTGSPAFYGRPVPGTDLTLSLKKIFAADSNGVYTNYYAQSDAYTVDYTSTSASDTCAVPDIPETSYSNGTVTVTWSGKKNIASYKLYRILYDSAAQCITGSYTDISSKITENTAVSQYGTYTAEDDTVTAGKAYQYLLVGTNGDASESAEAIVDTTDTSITASEMTAVYDSGTDSVYVSWTKGSDFTSTHGSCTLTGTSVKKNIRYDIGYRQYYYSSTTSIKTTDTFACRSCRGETVIYKYTFEAEDGTGANFTYTASVSIPASSSQASSAAVISGVKENADGYPVVAWAAVDSGAAYTLYRITSGADGIESAAAEVTADKTEVNGTYTVIDTVQAEDVAASAYTYILHTFIGSVDVGTSTHTYTIEYYNSALTYLYGIAGIRSDDHKSVALTITGYNLKDHISVYRKDAGSCTELSFDSAGWAANDETCTLTDTPAASGTYTYVAAVKTGSRYSASDYSKESSSFTVTE